MALMTPPLHTKGVYTLRAPFTAPSDVIYECIAIRRLEDFTDKGENPLKLVYEPFGLTQAHLDADKAQNASIVTLRSDRRPSIHVPDSFILNYPNVGSVEYQQVVLSLTLGAVPAFLDLEFVKDQIAAITSDTIGVTPTVTAHVAPSSGAVSQAQHDATEIVRNAAIANRTTDRARYLEQLAICETQAQQIRFLEQVLIDAGLLP